METFINLFDELVSRCFLVYEGIPITNLLYACTLFHVYDEIGNDLIFYIILKIN